MALRAERGRYAWNINKITICVICVERPGLHIGRNRGFLESRSDILVYAADDIIASPTWLAAIYEGFKNEKTILIGGNYNMRKVYVY